MRVHGFERLTTDVDLLVTREGLARIVLIAGDDPGDGAPKPVRFPDPSSVAVRPPDSPAVLPLAKLVELELASGMSAPHRAKDIGDVVELIQTLKLPRALGDELDASVRAKYDELWQLAQVWDPLSET